MNFEKKRITNKRAQGLPMTTIVILILVVIVLVGVAIFFFTGFAGGQEGLKEQMILSRCQTECGKILAGASESNTNFCKNYGGEVDCNEYMSCVYPDETVVSCP